LDISLRLPHKPLRLLGVLDKFPLIEGGKLIGAIGCSGATGDQDGVACKAGADTVK